MQPALASTFRWLLLVAGAGVTPATIGACTMSSSSIDDCDPPRKGTTERTVSREALTQVSQDGEIAVDECIYLCGFEDWQRVDRCTVTSGSESQTSAGATGMGGTGNTDETEVNISCQVEGRKYYCEGRRHACWARREAPVGTNLAGRWLADAAANEAASVQSFRSLNRELSRCGVRSSALLRRAARQEIGHARLLGRLAKARGCERPKQSYARSNKRSLVEIAFENAHEGCVAETYAALIALHQAQAAEDAKIRQAFSTIAREEAEHAELAWALHADLRAKLEPIERNRLDQVLEDAIGALESGEFDWTKGVAAEADAETVRRLAAELGIPSPGVESRMRRGLSGALRERARALVA